MSILPQKSKTVTLSCLTAVLLLTACGSGGGSGPDLSEVGSEASEFAADKDALIMSEGFSTQSVMEDPMFSAGSLVTDTGDMLAANGSNGAADVVTGVGMQVQSLETDNGGAADGSNRTGTIRVVNRQLGADSDSRQLSNVNALSADGNGGQSVVTANALSGADSSRSIIGASVLSQQGANASLIGANALNRRSSNGALINANALSGGRPLNASVNPNRLGNGGGATLNTRLGTSTNGLAGRLTRGLNRNN